MHQTLNLAVIGFGYTGQQHARASGAVKGLVLSAVVEPQASRRASVKVRALSDYRRVLDDSSIDAVSICLPHHLHEQAATEALQAGKHVFIEKPLAIDVAGGERLCTLARRLCRVLMVDMTHRFMPPVIEARELVLRGDVGDILAISENLVEGVGLFGSLPAWMFSRAEAGGGVALTSGIHLIDHVSWIAGQALSFDCARVCGSSDPGGVEATAAFSLRLSGGAPVHLILAWRDGANWLEGEVSIFGTRGTLTMQPWKGWKLLSNTGVREKMTFDDRLPMAERAYEGIKGALREFTAAVREGRDPIPLPEETLASQRIIEQAYRHEGLSSF